ncbi:unnamed protein product [Didymodactylos carnosus]|uniref:Uncharacterized protein n=2 Tax=Didymodactylos carnosus TaxID=1234261 RepID=A0A8S2D419_9BILA|nr:unnamed protein product [Didymodactylos carnosus]CAF3622359.1 unnamed protein product [Didymodactylos carnosus]
MEVIPEVREHIFAIIVSVVTKTPLCIIGSPGRSKTLSFQIVVQNLQGLQLSPRKFCRRLPAVDPFFCMGSKYSSAEDISTIFERAIRREEQYQQNHMSTRCVVFLDEALLPSQKKMVLKILHPYLDECRVSFVAIANKPFDAANANRMMCVFRSLPSEDDQKILAYGCLGLNYEDVEIETNLKNIISGLCNGYQKLLQSSDIPRVFHDRDFIYMLRELRLGLNPITQTYDQDQQCVNSITPLGLLRSLENNFNGIPRAQFQILVEIFFKCIQEECRRQYDFKFPSKQDYRDIISILHDSMELDSNRRRLYGRYKLIIDESEDESAAHLLYQVGILNATTTSEFRLSDFTDDINNELRNVKTLSDIKMCMETGKTILMINTGRLHGSLYDVFNQNFSIMATANERKIFSKVAIGPKTLDCIVHEQFQCIVHVKRSEFSQIPAPFLSRFQKYSLSIEDFYRIQLEQLPVNEQQIMMNVEDKVKTFIEHYGRQYFYGLTDNTLYSCLLLMIKIKQKTATQYESMLKINTDRVKTEEQYNVNSEADNEYQTSQEEGTQGIYAKADSIVYLDLQHYTQLMIRSKSIIEQNPGDTHQCLLRSILCRLIQLVSPESLALKLPTFVDSVSKYLCTNYFHNQEHFTLENFIQHLTSSTENDASDSTARSTTITTKVTIFTRTSSYVLSLNKFSKQQLFSNYISDNVDILNLTIIENAADLEEKFELFEQDQQKNVFVIVIDTQVGQQHQHIPFIRQLIDKTENNHNSCAYRQREFIRKYFIMLLHSPATELYHQACFPSIFLNNWDFYFFDTCSPGSAFHLQKMLQILCSSQQQQIDYDSESLCDLNALFDSALWDFSGRLQIFIQEVPTLVNSQDFYKLHTNISKRVQCLKNVLRKCTKLQQRIVNTYHESLSTQNMYNMIYQTSKEILSGRKFDGLVDSIQHQIEISFTTFTSNILIHLVNDYGLETLSRAFSASNKKSYEVMLNLIDYSLFINNDSANNKNQLFQISIHYPCVPTTPLYHLFHQRIKAHADDLKAKIIGKQNEEIDHNLRAKKMENTTDYLIDIRSELCRTIWNNDKVLREIIIELDQDIINTYSEDLIRTYCTIIEKSYENTSASNNAEPDKTINFISKWLQLIDDEDMNDYNESVHKQIWLVSHVYTSFEYDRNDLLSLYTASRILDNFDHNRQDKEIEEGLSRVEFRESVFRRMFDLLWSKLIKLCSENDQHQIELWTQTYAFINKYFPSNKVLHRAQLTKIKTKIEFMHLSYLILLNEQLLRPFELISALLDENNLLDTNTDVNTGCLKILQKIIELIQMYLQKERIDESHTTLMIDIIQWVLTLVPSVKEIEYLLTYLHEICQLRLPIKQFLFDQLATLLVDFRQKPINKQQKFDIVDKIRLLLPTVVQCINEQATLDGYVLPYHPFVIIDAERQGHTLIDLLFFISEII